MINPFSTGITYALIPKASVDKIPILSMGYGRTDAAVGSRLPLGVQRSDQLLEPGLGQDQVHRLQGRRPRQAQGQEDHATSITTAPTARSRSRRSRRCRRNTATSSSCWRSTIPARSRRRRGSRCVSRSPDWIFLWGWGVMNQVVHQGSRGQRLQDGPHDRRVVVGQRGRRGSRRRCRQGLSLGHVPCAGKTFKIHEDLKKFVYDKGKGAQPPGTRSARCSTTARSSTP